MILTKANTGTEQDSKLVDLQCSSPWKLAGLLTFLDFFKSPVNFIAAARTVEELSE